MSLKITVSDLKNHQIYEFGQLWRLPEAEQCKIGSLSLRYNLFKILFLTTFIPIKTLYNQIWNICVRFLKFFESEHFWRLLGRVIICDFLPLFLMSFSVTLFRFCGSLRSKFKPGGILLSTHWWFWIRFLLFFKAEDFFFLWLIVSEYVLDDFISTFFVVNFPIKISFLFA